MTGRDIRRAEASRVASARVAAWRAIGWDAIACGRPMGLFRKKHFGCGCRLCKPWKWEWAAKEHAKHSDLVREASASYEWGRP